MPENFEWRTEEERDEVWQDASAAEATPAGRRWWLALLLLLLLVSGAYAAYGEAEERVLEAEALTAEDVRASHRLAQAAAEGGDRELFTTVLSGRDRRWTRTQFQLLEEGLLFDDAARALDLQPLQEQGTIVDVSFSPDLREAEVVSEHTVASTPDKEGVALQQVHVYRRGEQGWLLSPPDAEWWGPWQLWQGQRLTLHYTERDAAVAERLAGDLDRMLGEMCAVLEELNCPPNMRVRVRLDRDPDSVQRTARAQVSTMGAGELALPGPSLTGAPADDAAYGTVYPAYARRVVSAVVSDLVGYRCCEQIVFFRAALDWQLAQLGLQSWPLTLDHYLQVAQELDGPGRLAHLWTLNELPDGERTDRWHVYSLVELLLEQGEGTVDAALLQRRLGAADTVMRWIEIVSDHHSVNSLEAAWRAYLVERTSAWQAAPPPPEQELLLACRINRRAEIFRYRAREGRWTRGLPRLDLVPGVVLNGVVGLPDGSGLLVSAWDETEAQGKLLFWQPDGVRQLETERTSFDLHLGDLSERNIDPQGRYVGVWARNRDSGDSGHALLDLQSCLDGQCHWEAIGGWPIWSPDGRHVLYSQDDNTMLQSLIMRRLREDAAPRQVAQGLRPFWLNSEVFGYVAGDHLTLVRVSGEEERPLLNISSLSEQVTDDRYVAVEHVLASPRADGPMIVFLRNPGGGQNFVVLLYLEERTSWQDETAKVGDVEVLLQTRLRIFGPPLATVSPDGRWLALHTAGQGEARFLLFDLQSGEAVVESETAFGRQVAAEWSGDGQWLARLSGRYIELIAPQHGPYRRPLLPLSESSQTTPRCSDLAWVNPAPG